MKTKIQILCIGILIGCMIAAVPALFSLYVWKRSAQEELRNSDMRNAKIGAGLTNAASQAANNKRLDELETEYEQSKKKLADLENGTRSVEQARIDAEEAAKQKEAAVDWIRRHSK